MADRHRSSIMAFVLCLAATSMSEATSPGSAKTCVVLARAQDAHAQTSAKPVTIDVDRAYGTLAFHGVVERTDTGEDYEYRVRLAITFRPNERTNHVPVANLIVCELVATVPRERPQPAERLFRERRAISVVLSDDGDTKPMPELTFRLAKSVAARAGHVGLAVTDGRLAWPISTELK